MSINHIPVVQNMVKAGMKGFEASAWWGLFMPAGTPPETVQALTDGLATALKAPALRSTLQAQGE